MFDKNIVFIEGLVGNDFKYGKTTDGKPFATFTLCINSFTKDMADTLDRTSSAAMVRVFIYTKQQIEYLSSKKMHRGVRVSVFGRLSTHKSEYKGISYISLCVISRDISILRKNKETKKLKDNGETDNDDLPVAAD